MHRQYSEIRAMGAGYNLRSYAWASAYVVAMTIDMVLIKKVIHEVGLSTWGLVYYNNLIAFLFCPVVALINGDMHKAILEGEIVGLMDIRVLGPVIVSCVGGAVAE
eukprot:scaffold1536_cov397-Prasinococcus_capsulatus_cf.AAC.14